MLTTCSWSSWEFASSAVMERMCPGGTTILATWLFDQCFFSSNLVHIQHNIYQILISSCFYIHYFCVKLFWLIKWDLLKEPLKEEAVRYFSVYICIMLVLGPLSTLQVYAFSAHLCIQMLICSDVQTLEELSLSVLSRLEEVVKEQRRWREIAEAHIQLLRDFAFQEWLCSQNLEHFYQT